MKAGAPLLAVLALALAAWFGAGWHGTEPFFGLVLPYGAVLAFLIGITWRVLLWARSPVPFNITTTCGQQYTLPWIRSSRLGNPHTRWGVAGRVLFEMLAFRSLLRNVKQEWVESEGEAPRLVFKASPALWVGALVFHYSLLLVLLHHARFFFDPVPAWVNGLEGLDAFFRVGSVAFFLSGLTLALAVLFLLVRRFTTPWLRYLSLPADFFPLYLLLGIALTGGLLHYTALRTDIPSVKAFCLGLVRLHPVAPFGTGPLFHVHLALVSVLFAYLPFSKLAHMVSLPLSPTRNMLGASRLEHHDNPWNSPVKLHTYEEYENEYRDKMKAAGVPVEKEAP
jgi:[DsrC]-trisulfide reductase subunit M